MRFPLRPVLGTVITIFFYNAVFALIAQSQPRPGLLPTVRAMRFFAMVQGIADLLSLTFLIHWLGGAKNPFVFFYFFHMIIGSILLPRKHSYYLAVIAAVLANGMVWGEYSGLLIHYKYESIFGTSRLDSFNCNFVLACILTSSLFLSVYLASSITGDLRRKEDEVESAYINLQKVEEEKSYFMRKASHELRSPLIAIQSFVQIFLKGLVGDISHEQRGIFERMDVRLRSLLDLTKELLLLSRLRVLDSPQNLSRFDFGEVVKQSSELLSPWAKDKDIELSLETEPVFLVGDREGLGEVATNLISNGIKYTPRGGRVTVVLRSEGAKACFSVEDSGIGISEEDQPNVFHEFFRAAEAKRMTEAGTGLGLSIAKRIAEMHGGIISLTSAPGRGTRFDVELPLDASRMHPP
jgi:signal transduction histidine kinase